jgi:N-acyl-phosphatidylethanolamine-hydrolysing phospholipase D
VPTLSALEDRRRLQVIAPLGVGAYFEERGYRRIVELDWHGTHAMAGLRVSAVPAIHFSKRSLFDRNQTLWCGFLIETPARRVYFAGDTAYGPVFPELGRQLAPLDVALVPIGAYEPRRLMRASHATPEEAVRIGRGLGARRLVAMHWGTIQLTDEPPFEPPERFRAAARAAGYGDDDAWVMPIGETRPI